MWMMGWEEGDEEWFRGDLRSGSSGAMYRWTLTPPFRSLSRLTRLRFHAPFSSRHSPSTLSLAISPSSLELYVHYASRKIRIANAKNRATLSLRESTLNRQATELTPRLALHCSESPDFRSPLPSRSRLPARIAGSNGVSLSKALVFPLGANTRTHAPPLDSSSQSFKTCLPLSPPTHAHPIPSAWSLSLPACSPALWTSLPLRSNLYLLLLLLPSSSSAHCPPSLLRTGCDFLLGWKRSSRLRPSPPLFGSFRDSAFYITLTIDPSYFPPC